MPANKELLVCRKIIDLAAMASVWSTHEAWEDVAIINDNIRNASYELHELIAERLNKRRNSA